MRLLIVVVGNEFDDCSVVVVDIGGGTGSGVVVVIGGVVDISGTRVFTKRKFRP